MQRKLRESYDKIMRPPDPKEGQDGQVLHEGGLGRPQTSREQRDLVLEDLLGQNDVLYLLYQDEHHEPTSQADEG